MSATNPCSALFSAVFAQRQQAQQFREVLPPLRLDVVNPYDDPTVTKFKLDMRRKAEVLEYKQTVGATVREPKSAAWASIVRQSGRRPPPVCPTPLTPIVSSVDRSGVPRGGDTDVLYLDPTVPIYHLINPVNERSYVQFDNVIPDPFLVVVRPSVFLENEVSGIVASGMFTSSIQMPRYRMRLVCPLALTVSGNTSARTPSGVTPTITLTIAVQLFYNETMIAQTDPYSRTIVVAFPLANEGSTDFTMTKYIWTADAQLLAQAGNGYVYTVRVAANARFSSDFDTSKISATITANIPVNYSDSPNSGILVPTPSPLPIQDGTLMLVP